MTAQDLTMLLYIALFAFLAFSFWLLCAYLRERKYRKKPYYALADIGWRSSSPPSPLQRVHSMALVGDIGSNGSIEDDPVLQAIQHWKTEAGANSSIIFLGDNIYPIGLPPENSYRYEQSLQRLQNQLALFKDYKGKVIYLSGNHDWNKGRKDGYSFVLRQEKFIIEQLQDPTAYLPREGCLGPVSWEINEQLLLIVINSQWWVQQGYKPLKGSYACAYESPAEFFPALEKLLAQNKHRFIVLASHHPLYSNALHGGKFTVKQHIFPLTFIHKKAMVPLPLAGTIFRIYRKYIGAHEDMSFPPFRKFRKRLLKILHQHNSIFHVGGHDHNLQYFQVKGNHYAVSGAGSKTSFVAKGGKASFSHENKGFMVLDQYKDGTIWLRVLEPSTEAAEPPMLAYRKCIYRAPTRLLPEEELPGDSAEGL